MEFDRLTEDSKRAFSIAQQEAQRLGYAAAQPQSVGTVQIDDVRQQKVIEFARKRQRVGRIYLYMLVALIVAFILLATQAPELFLFIGPMSFALANSPVLNWQPIAGWSPLLVLVVLGLVFVLFLTISLPLSWYNGFVLSRRYSLYKGTPLTWLKDLGKSLLIFFTQVVLLVELIALLRVVQAQTWWARAALVQFLYSILLARFGSPRILAFLNKIEPMPEGEVTRRFHELLARLRIPTFGIFQIKVSHKTGGANAFFVSWGKGRRVLMTDTMVENFSPDEIEAILAHELAHLIHHDIWTRLVMRGLIFLGLFYILDLYLTSFTTSVDPSSPLALFQPFFPLLGFILLLVFASITMRYRRYQEYRADEFALQTTGKIQAFKDAMTRLTNMNMLVAASTRRARHPTSHPTLLKRLKHADEFAARNAAPAGSIQA